MGKKADVFLVGSVPLETVDEVFRTCGTLIGDRVLSLPDGEVGDRRFWITYVAQGTFRGHPDIETVTQPPEGWMSSRMEDALSFKLKPGVTDLHFDRLGYAEPAIESYAAFKKARDAGIIPAGVRFQFAFPFPQDVTFLFFHHTEDHATVMAAYEEVLLRELATICQEIPPSDLCIQWDVCTDLLEMTGRYYSWSRPESAWDRYLDPLSRLPRAVPTEALMGFHFCYGTWPQKPALMPEDLSLSVMFANAAVSNSGRAVDFVHMTVPKNRVDDMYFRPLRDLQIGETAVYLGVINSDGVEGARERINAARKHLPEFGIAGECGFGRENPEDVPGILELHKQIADELLS